jgi:hypothetical protein
MGPVVDLSPWQGMSDDLEAVEQAADHIMDRITELLEILRGQKAPATRFDPKNSDLPRIGNFKKAKKAKNK